MMLSVEPYVRRSKQYFRKLAMKPEIWLCFRGLAYVAAGLGLSAASLANYAMPLAMGYVCGCSGWGTLLGALGGSLGYVLFWGASGNQGIVWMLGALGIHLFCRKNVTVQTPLLIPALSGLLVSAAGVFFQTWMGDTTPVGVYLLRVALACGSSFLARQVMTRRNPITDWLSCGCCVLALAQMAPVPWLNFGMIAAGVLAVRSAFPGVALAGLALDLASVTPVGMTGVLCGSYFLRFLPQYPKWLGALAPIGACLAVSALTKKWDMLPLPGLVLGAMLGAVLPGAARVPARRGETGVAQVRLEMAAGALFQTQQLLLEAPQIPVDEEALVERAAEQACDGCPCYKGCKDSRKLRRLPGAILYKPLLCVEELPVVCRKASRFLTALHHSQEQLRAIRADRERQWEYRTAVIQQYRFLGEYLRDLSDQLAKKAQNNAPCYEAKVEIFANRPQEENGDRCNLFAGVKCRYYVMLCDGMGTGIGAVQEGKTAVSLLKKMLTAGYPANHALESLNSICALRSRAGAVTVDLLELELDTGNAVLYKWGAAPSYVISSFGAEKIGTAGPPPGLSITDQRETAYRLSLRRGELLVLVSDGVGEEEALHQCRKMAGLSPGEVAKGLLTDSQRAGEDDATVVTVRLDPGFASV